MFRKSNLVNKYLKIKTSSTAINRYRWKNRMKLCNKSERYRFRNPLMTFAFQYCKSRRILKLKAFRECRSSGFIWHQVFRLYSFNRRGHAIAIILNDEISTKWINRCDFNLSIVYILFLECQRLTLTLSIFKCCLYIWLPIGICDALRIWFVH